MLSIGSKWNDPRNITDSIYSHAMFVWIAPEYLSLECGVFGSFSQSIVLDYPAHQKQNFHERT